MGKTIDIGGRIHNPEVGNVVTGANEILDDTKNKKQDVINGEVDAALEALDANKQDNLTFDQTPTESSTNPVTSGGVYAADLVLQQAIEAILTLIPSAASALNQLADKSFVNSSIATASATFRGTYNLVSDLHLSVTASHQDIATALASAVSTADNNDYCFVQIPTSDTSSDIRVTERYKFNGTAWGYEYDLNNSGFTATQWEAINSGITALLVTKLGALPTAAELAISLAGKQNVLTFDNVPVSGSDNPVKSGGLYQSFTAIDAKFPSDASADNKLVAENRLAAYVTAIIEALDASFDLTSADGHVTFRMTQTNGVIASVQILTSDIASASQVSTNTADIAALQAAYAGLTQSDIIVVNGALPSSGQQQNIIYRQPDPDHTPPQFYSDYMWNGSVWVLMATYNNAIEQQPKKGSQNPIASGGIWDVMSKYVYVPIDFIPSSGYYSSTGSLVNVGNVKCVNTGKIEISSTIKKIKYSTWLNSGGYEIIFWDSENNILTGISVLGTGSTLEKTIDLTLPDYVNAKYFAVSGYGEASEIAAFYCHVSSDKNFEDEFINIDEKFAEVDNNFTQTNQKINSVERFFKGNTVYKLNGYIDIYGYFTSSNTYRASGFIRISGNERIEIKNVFAGPSSLLIAFYDENRAFISGIGNNTSVIIEGDNIPEGTKYIRVGTSEATSNNAVIQISTDVGLLELISEVSDELENAVENKKLNILIFGDSISDCCNLSVTDDKTSQYSFRDPSNSYVDAQGHSIAYNMWPYLMQKYIRCYDVRNYAKSGASYKDSSRSSGNERQNVSYQIEVAVNDLGNPNNVFPTDGTFIPDIVIFALGTNDSDPNDTYESAMAKTVMNQEGTAFDVPATLANLDKTKTAEAIRWAFLKIKSTFPQSLCLCVLPIQKAASSNPGINELLEKMAKRYSIIVIDGASNLGIIQDTETEGGLGENLKDGLHPNDKGQNLYTRMMVKAIQTNYINFSKMNP